MHRPGSGILQTVSRLAADQILPSVLHALIFRAGELRLKTARRYGTAIQHCIGIRRLQADIALVAAHGKTKTDLIIRIRST